jgi:Cu/Ag efflux protein CusF
MPAQQQMSAAQQNAIARAAIQARAVLMQQQIYSQTVTPANTPTITVNPRNVGLILGFYVKVVATINNGSAVQINPTDLANANLLSQITFNDLQNNTRIQTPGWHLNMMNTIKERRVYGTSFVRTTGFDAPINYGSNWTGEISNSGNIAAAGNGTMTMWYYVPLAYTKQDLRGAVYGNVVNATMQLNLTFAGQNGISVAAANGSDSTLAMYVGNAAGSVSAVTITSATVTVYQEYYDQLPMGPNGVLLPITDLATIYELKQTTQTNIVAGQDFPYQYANFRNFLSTITGYVNNGTTGARGVGADINYWALQSANFTNIRKVEPALQSLITRQKIGVDMPPGFYYFDTRERPINTTQYGNMQLVLNAATATNNPYELVAVEDFALVQTLSMAGSLAAS